MLGTFLQDLSGHKEFWPWKNYLYIFHFRFEKFPLNQIHWNYISNFLFFLCEPVVVYFLYSWFFLSYFSLSLLYFESVASIIAVIVMRCLLLLLFVIAILYLSWNLVSDEWRRIKKNNLSIMYHLVSFSLKAQKQWI